MENDKWNLSEDFGANAFLNRRHPFDDYQHLLPEDIRESVNTRAEQRQFQSAHELYKYVENLIRRS